MAQQSGGAQWMPMPLSLDWEFHEPISATGSTIYAQADQASQNYMMSIGRIKQRLVNYLPVKSGDNMQLRTREGLEQVASGVSKSATVSIPRGIFYLQSLGFLTEIWDTTIYTRTAADTYTTTGTVGAATEGPGGATEGIQTNGAKYGFVSTVSKSVIVSNSGGHTAVSDGDFPTSVVPTPVYLDSYIFIPALSSRKIYNCNVGDPTSWQASTFIETEETGGFIVALARQGRYVVALCEDHIEFFRDAAIPSPNSPLQRVPEMMINVGCINRATVAIYQDTIYFAGRTRSGKYGVFRITDAGKIEEIGNDSISRIVRFLGGDNKVTGNITSWTQTTSSLLNFASGYIQTHYGKVYYCLCLNAGRSVITGAKLPAAFLYDPELKLWVEIMNTTYFAAAEVMGAGGWTFPFGTLAAESGGLHAYDTLMQNAYGGTNGTELCSLDPVTVTGESVSTAGGCVSSPSYTLRTPAIVQWPITDFGTPAAKVGSGFQVAWHYPTAGNPTDFAGYASAILYRWGKYMNASEWDTGPTVDLQASMTFTETADAGEELRTSRQHLGRFVNAAFTFVCPYIADTNVGAIRMRIQEQMAP